MAPDITPLAPEDFTKGQQAWLTFLNGTTASPWLLDILFKDPAGNRLPMVCFPAEHVLWLVSTVGTTAIQTRFVILDQTAGSLGKFGIVLYATDNQNKRLSAYYSSTLYTPTLPNGETVVPVIGNADDSDMVPHVAVAQWLANWANIPLTVDIFKNSYGLLQGYTFSYNEVLNNLFATSTYKDMVLGVVLGLHKYYNADSTEPGYTFGLVLRIYNTGTLSGKSSATFFDHSMPCPPGY